MMNNAVDCCKIPYKRARRNKCGVVYKHIQADKIRDYGGGKWLKRDIKRKSAGPDPSA